jgi:hypothetical protein
LNNGAEINKNGGVFIRDHAYDFTKKIQVAMAYTIRKEGQGGIPPTSTAIGQQCKVSKKFTKKIAAELENHGQVLTPCEVQQHREPPKTRNKDVV